MITLLLIENDPAMLARMQELLVNYPSVGVRIGNSATDVIAEQGCAQIIVFGKLTECGRSFDELLPEIRVEVLVISVYPNDWGIRPHKYVSRSSGFFDADFRDAVQEALTEV